MNMRNFKRTHLTFHEWYTFVLNATKKIENLPWINTSELNTLNLFKNREFKN